MVVIDASVAYKWSAKNEDYSELALSILENHIKDKEKILVPDLILYELVNAWTTKTTISLPKIKSNLKDLQQVNLQVEVMSYELINKAAVFAKKYKVSVYDAAYAVLARQKKCKLITADGKFASQVKLSFIENLKDYSLTGG